MVNQNNLRDGFLLRFQFIQIFFYNLIACLSWLGKFVSRTDVSCVIFGITEYFKLAFEKAISLNKISAKQDDIVDPTLRGSIFSFVERYPVESAYITEYVLPSLQFTAIFQVGSNVFLVHHNNVLTRGFLKATASMSVIMLNKVEYDKEISSSDVILPFFKEPSVSLCKILLDDNFFRQLLLQRFVPAHTKKFVCNLVGETTHNLGKELFGVQKLGALDLASSMPKKATWKTFHQGLEGGLVSALGNPGGFYIGSIVPRSWGNAFLEEFTYNNIAASKLCIAVNDYLVNNVVSFNLVASLPFNVSSDEI